MNNLVITLMMLLVLGTGFLLGSKEALSDDKYGALESNSGSDNLKSQENGNGDLSGSEEQHKTTDAGTFDLQDLWTIYENIYYAVDSWITELLYRPLDNTNPFQVRISPADAKNIAQSFIEEPGATAGEPKLVIIDGKATYIVPVVLYGNIVGEIYIDAQTGENLGGTGGVSDNETNFTENNQLNDTESENNSENGSNNELNNPEDSGTDNTNNRNVNEGSNNENSQAADNGYYEPITNSNS